MELSSRQASNYVYIYTQTHTQWLPTLRDNRMKKEKKKINCKAYLCPLYKLYMVYYQCREASAAMTPASHPCTRLTNTERQRQIRKPGR